jgi:uncharacterized membrane protein YfcA
MTSEAHATELPFSLRQTLAFFAAVMAIMEGAAVFAVSQGGDWRLLVFLQPACLVTALIVGVWLGAMFAPEVIRREQPRVLVPRARPSTSPAALHAEAAA